MKNHMPYRRGNVPAGCGGFTLTELLVVLAITALLAALAVGTTTKALHKSRSIECLARMKNLGTGILLYCQDHGGEFPRSFHSAYPYGQPGWGKAILPYIGLPENMPKSAWQTHFNAEYRCPCDGNTREWSYGLNVFFELNPDYDDYEGSPATWRRTVSLPSPSRTVLLAELKTTSADHVMAHFWTGPGGNKEVDDSRHDGQSTFVFADGHAEPLPLAATFDPAAGINRWNPAAAGQN